MRLGLRGVKLFIQIQICIVAVFNQHKRPRPRGNWPLARQSGSETLQHRVNYRYSRTEALIPNSPQNDPDKKKGFDSIDRRHYGDLRYTINIEAVIQKQA